MHVLEKYCEFLKAGDVEKFCDLFTEDAIFHDEAPTQIGMDALHLEGKAAIKDTFSIVIPPEGIEIENIAVYGNAMRYDLKNGDVTFLALGVMKDENGLIKEYHVVIPK